MKKIILLVLALIIGVWVYDYFLKPPQFKAGEVAPDFEAELISGAPFKLSDLRGNYVLLDFWGSWCGPCLKEIPDLKSFKSRFAEVTFANDAKLMIVSVALEKSDKFTRAIIEREELNWPHHIIDVRPVVMLSPIAQKYSVKELPSKFLINPAGEILATNLSYEHMAKILQSQR